MAQTEPARKCNLNVSPNFISARQRKMLEKTEGGSDQKSGADLFKPRGLGHRSSRNTLRNRRLRRVAQVPPQLIFSPRQPAEE